MADQAVRLNQVTVDESASNFVLEAKKHFKLQRQKAGYENIWRLVEDSYYNKSSDFYDGKAGVKDAINFKTVERIVTKMKKILFPADQDWFDAVAEDEENEVQIAQALEAKSLLFEQYDDMSIKMIYIKEFRDVTTYGSVWSKTRWETIVKTSYRRDKKNRRVPKFDVEYDNPEIYTPSIWDVYADIKDEKLKGLVIEEIVKDFQDLWENREQQNDEGETEGIYRNVKRLKEFKNPEVRDSAREHSEAIRGVADHSFGVHEQKIRILECWGPIPKWFLTKSLEDKNMGLMADGLIVVAITGDEGENAKAEVLRISDNPFDHQQKPYDIARYTAVNGRLYGIGAIEHNITMEMGANTVLNQTLDTLTFNLRPKWLLDEGAEIDPASLKDLDEQIIETQDINGLEALRPNDFTATALAVIGFFKNAGEEVTGATPNVAGQALGSSVERTTTGVVSTQSNALDRFELAVETFVEEKVRSQMRKIWALNQQFLPKGRSIRLIGGELKRVKPRNIALPNIRFISISNQIEKELRINQSNILLQNVTGLAQFGLDPIPIALEQIKLMGWQKIIPEVDKRPNSEERLEQTPEGEIILLRLGKKVRIDFDDDHDAFIRAYRGLLEEAQLPTNVRTNTEKALGERIAAKAMKQNPQAFANVIRSRTTNERTTS